MDEGFIFSGLLVSTTVHMEQKNCKLSEAIRVHYTDVRVLLER